jgi:hypothetical protein
MLFYKSSSGSRKKISTEKLLNLFQGAYRDIPVSGYNSTPPLGLLEAVNVLRIRKLENLRVKLFNYITVANATSSAQRFLHNLRRWSAAPWRGLRL